MRPVLFLFVLLLGFACGSPATGVDAGSDAGGLAVGPNSVTGWSNGEPLAMVSSAAQFTSAPRPSLLVRLSEHTTACDPSRPSGIASPGKRMLTLSVDVPDAGVVAPGQYAATLEVVMPNCRTQMSSPGGDDVNPLNALDVSTSASVTVLDAGSRVQGTFTATIGSGDSLTGTFDAEFCTFVGSGGQRQAKCL